VPPKLCLAEPTPNKRKEARAAASIVVPGTTVAGFTHAEQSNRGLNSALTFRARHHSGWLSPRRPTDRRPDQHTHLSCLPKQWLAEPTPTKRTEARAGRSPFVPTTTVANLSHADRENKVLSSHHSCRARHHRGLLSRRREQRPEQRSHLSCLRPQWLVETTPIKRTEARSAPSPVVPATTVAGCAHADQAKRGQNSALTSRTRQHSGWRSPRPPSVQKPELCTLLSCR
jgi:hypothetical protein